MRSLLALQNSNFPEKDSDISFFLLKLKEYSSQSSETYLKYLIFKDSLLDVIAMLIDLSRELQKAEDFGGLGERVHGLKQLYNSVLNETYCDLLDSTQEEVKL
jgi:hypothetical protein